MAIKAIVLDIDGTLLNDQKVITPKTRESLLRAQEAGVKLVLASGRPLPAMLKFSKELKMEHYHGLLLSNNGACVTDCATEEMLFSQSISKEIGAALLAHLANFEVKPMVAHKDYMYVNNVYDCMITAPPHGLKNIIEYESRSGNFKLCEVDNLAEFVDFPLHKILVAGEPEYLEENWKAIMRPFEGRVSGYFSAPFYFEFTDKGIDKAFALDKSLQPLGISSENVISFGDGENDTSIIAYAGVGVAMGNAIDALKASASEITLSNNEDGIAHMLERYL
ncbi:Cof-type HAD-IIB family hydrolase [uncultured Trichococcus sp.]|uniref:Cof-type HAD-IIB family hydrolase n=1 Tax=uncultured Trichococcus sp. TaxID=189665 RepID=UPI002A1880A9|nr:Cof-type HAD-IIB family hydrolase [uncultured Trichococcus sp.]